MCDEVDRVRERWRAQRTAPGASRIVGWCARLGFGTGRRGGLAPCLWAWRLRFQLRASRSHYRTFLLTGLIGHCLLTCAARLAIPKPARVTERFAIPKPSRDRKGAVCDEVDRVRERCRAQGNAPGASRIVGWRARLGFGTGRAAASRPACGHGAYDSSCGHRAPTTFLRVANLIGHRSLPVAARFGRSNLRPSEGAVCDQAARTRCRR